MASGSASVMPDARGTRPEDERLGARRTTVYALQHILTMYGGLIAVPLVVASAAGYDAQTTALLVAAALFVGGFATFLQAWGLPKIGSQLPLVQLSLIHI